LAPKLSRTGLVWYFIVFGPNLPHFSIQCFLHIHLVSNLCNIFSFRIMDPVPEKRSKNRDDGVGSSMRGRKLSMKRSTPPPPTPPPSDHDEDGELEALKMHAPLRVATRSRLSTRRRRPSPPSLIIEGSHLCGSADVPVLAVLVLLSHRLVPLNLPPQAQAYG
jgi:hypothetical protein